MDIPCPGCGTLLDVTATSCGTCLRNRTRQEIFRGARQVKEREDLIRTRPRRIAVNVLVVAALLGAAGYAWVHYPAQIQGLWKMAMERFSPPPPAPAPAPAPVQTAASDPAPAPVVQTPAAPASSLPAFPKPAPAAASAQFDDSWTIKGRAYDLFSLKGISKAEITFTDGSTDQKFRARTDAKGAYRIKLPRKKEGGYAVAVMHKQYGASYLDEMEPPYSSQSRSRRNDAVELLNVLHVPVLLPAHEDTLEHNLIMIPAETESQ